MKVDGTIVKIPITWTNSNLHSYAVEGAIYPDELNGFPLISIPLEQTQVSDFEVLAIRKTAFDQGLEEELELEFPSNAKLISLRKLAEKGSEITFLDILPILYDSISEKYF